MSITEILERCAHDITTRSEREGHSSWEKHLTTLTKVNFGIQRRPAGSSGALPNVIMHLAKKAAAPGDLAQNTPSPPAASLIFGVVVRTGDIIEK